MVMAGETAKPEQVRFSFEELGKIIEAYEDADYEHNGACFVNQVYDEPGFSTLTGQELEDWKHKFPRIDDEEVARLECELEAAEAQLISTLGLASAEIIPGLCESYHNECSRRQLEVSLGQDKHDPWISAITIDSLGLHPADMIAGAIAMSTLTGQAYIMHGGIRADGAYNYMCVEVGPESSTDEIVAQFEARGLDLASASEGN
jgi:hypothetical protein